MHSAESAETSVAQRTTVVAAPDSTSLRNEGGRDKSNPRTKVKPRRRIIDPEASPLVDQADGLIHPSGMFDPSLSGISEWVSIVLPLEKDSTPKPLVHSVIEDGGELEPTTKGNEFTLSSEATPTIGSRIGLSTDTTHRLLVGKALPTKKICLMSTPTSASATSAELNMVAF